MRLNKKYIAFRDKWWGLPLILPPLMLPIVSQLNTYAHVASGDVALIYLSLALMMSMMVFFSWAALPGIVLAIFIRKYPQIGLAETLPAIAHFLFAIVLSWGGYRVFNPRRNAVSHGVPRLVFQRIFWQVFCSATLFLLLFQFAAFVGMYESRLSLMGGSPFNINALINYQGILVGNLIGVPIFYFILRVIRNPFHLRGYYSQLKLQFDRKVTKTEVVIWLLVLTVLMTLLCMPLNVNSSIFSTNYTLSLLLPVMLWGAMRYGYRFISLVWTPVLIIAICHYQSYTPYYAGYDVQLAITSSSFLVFSFIVNYIAVLATRQRTVNGRARRLAFLDPVVHLPNLRALNRDLRSAPWSALCFLHVPELEILVKHYGIMLRIQYKQQLSHWITEKLGPGESVYQMSGPDLLLRLNTESHQQRIEALDEYIKQFRFIWDGMSFQPQVGVSYCYVRSPVSHISLLLGEMSTIAELSVMTNSPENLERRGAMNLQRNLKDKVKMMNHLQHALEHDLFCLVAQPIQGIRGDIFHEVLLRLQDEEGEVIQPEVFLPVAHEFGLASRIDLWVIEHTLRFMAEHRAAMPARRFALNLSAPSICRANFSREVSKLLSKYQIEAWQLIFEVTESYALLNAEQAQATLRDLQQLGCRIAIDDFGTGYASYARLKDINADILKIDGSFIRNMISNSLDYQIVASICHLARMKKMQVVAEFVESEEIRSAVASLGIDYMQGFLIGEPQSLMETLDTPAPVTRA
ncbi:bifunctional diguanylate cyclase/phosphodiesterase [Citrobacter rodentium]|uniref:Signal transduction protein n=2 Tax=Citrobacter rodentium TaxID=67825 RepID=D2TTD0_CITRI|nr:sensor domain-containing phosphodiesterase [Citrobacter rodentium]KIQ50484.1 c-di-GMP phosphodiesterase [Citrobacter rodentium]QBY28947.1 sensor domain-containing phosphodiesterase [Citrobacter rodentium]UHO29194.1 sensor domain-containing phosphodiesterase [Citrobacter rodentium NBRC 105723 = DSM 16636]CBG89191.1 putative signal transduction protein [Citrobacter rodentium ICC168]HAT8011783.1 sensor domain-containing phosphodiesterase [Citrobacter rodentium NBRC 105723 = DSM 16636]